MKKFLLLLLVLAIAAGSIYFYKSRKDYEILKDGDYAYRVNSDGTASIVSFDNAQHQSFVVVPSYLGEYEVSTILRRAFDCQNIEELVINDAIDYIEDEGFYNCQNIRALSWPSHLILDAPMKDLTGVDELTISFGDDGFMRDYAENSHPSWYDSRETITTLRIENGVRYLSNNAFMDLSALQYVILPETVESIGNRTFYNCNSLTSLNLTSTLKSIGREAFNGDKKAKAVNYLTIPQSVNYLGSNAFGTSYYLLAYKDSYAAKYLDRNGLVYQPIELALNKEISSVGLGEQIQLENTELPKGFDDEVSFLSLDQKKATVDESGVLTAISPGEATVRLQTASGYVDSKVKINDISEDQRFIILNVSDLFRITPEEFDMFTDPINSNYTYLSSDENIAYVSINGDVAAFKSGLSDISIIDTNEQLAHYLVRVVRKVKEIKLESDSIKIRKGSSYQINATVLPANADNKKLIYESSNPNVAVVSEDGQITALSYGDCKITISSCDGSGVKQTFRIVVSNSKVSVETQLAIMMPGKTFDIRYNTSSQDIMFSSSDESIATVDQKGRITAHAPGSCTISISNLHMSAYSTVNCVVYDAKAYGIDISRWNGNHLTESHFRKTKDAGFDFVYIRAGYGNDTKDANFDKNYENARAAGLDIGAYHYITAINAEQARVEAGEMLKWISGKKFSYPIAVDIEDRSHKYMSQNTFNSIVNAYCEVMEKAGYTCIVYSYASMLNKTDGAHDCWVAQWGATSPDRFHGNYTIWQFTDKGNVPGFSGYVDMDISFYDYPAYIKENHFNGY